MEGLLQPQEPREVEVGTTERRQALNLEPFELAEAQVDETPDACLRQATTSVISSILLVSSCDHVCLDHATALLSGVF